MYSDAGLTNSAKATNQKTVENMTTTTTYSMMPILLIFLACFKSCGEIYQYRNIFTYITSGSSSDCIFDLRILNNCFPFLEISEVTSWG